MKKRIFMGISILSFLIILILVVTNHIQGMDEWIYETMMLGRTPFWDTFFIVLTKLGNPITSILLSVILFLLLPKKEKKDFTIGVLGGVSINTLFKYIIRRKRPMHLKLIQQGGYSFPSGHSMIAVAIFGFLMVWGISNIKNKWGKVSIFLLGTFLILGIGISRIYVGVHYPSDVLGGFLLSISIQIGIHMKGE